MSAELLPAPEVGSFSYIAEQAWVSYLAGTSRTQEEASQEFRRELKRFASQQNDSGEA